MAKSNWIDAAIYAGRKTNSDLADHVFERDP